MAPDIQWHQLSFILLFIIIAVFISWRLSLQLIPSILLSSLRSIIQLISLGYVLLWIFNLNQPWLIMFFFLIMILLASHTIFNRLDKKDRENWNFFYFSFIAVFISGVSVVFVVTTLIVDTKPWYNPRIFLPLAGMILGNGLNSIALSLTAYVRGVRHEEEAIGARLAYGATIREATLGIERHAIQQALLPQLNSMSAAGIVFIPGMMTGQILAGAEPLAAAFYQIVVMMMLLGSSSIGATIMLLLERRVFFTSDGMMKR